MSFFDFFGYFVASMIIWVIGLSVIGALLK
jgi:hypothetical protein